MSTRELCSTNKLRLNKQHPLTQGLILGWVFNSKAGNPQELISQRLATGKAGNPVWTPTGPSFDGDADAYSFNTPMVNTRPAVWTTLVCSTLNGTPATDGAFQRQLSIPDVATASVLVGYDTSKNKYRVGLGTSSVTMAAWASLPDASTIAANVGNTFTWVWVADGTLTAANQKIYRNGILIDNTTTINGSGTIVAWNGTVSLGGATAVERSCFDTIHHVYMWNRQLSAAEVFSITKQPYQIFRQEKRWASQTIAELTAVYSDLALRWDCLNIINSDSSLRYDILNTIASDSTLKFDINNIIASSSALRFDINNIITSDSSLRWDMAGTVSSDLTTRFDILNQIASDLGLRFDILQGVSSDLILKFDLNSMVQSDITALWNMAGGVWSDCTIRYAVNQDAGVGYFIIQTDSDKHAKYNRHKNFKRRYKVI